MKTTVYKEKNRIVEAFEFSFELKEAWPSWFLDLIVEGRVDFNKTENFCRIRRNNENMTVLVVESGQFIVKDDTVILAYEILSFYHKYAVKYEKEDGRIYWHD